MKCYLRLSDVTVAYPIFDFASRRLLGRGGINHFAGGLLRPAGRSHVIVQALSNINISLESGDRLGLIGHNGAGKSTLLRVMAGALFPSQGTISSAGVIGPMFDISLGMEMDATGFENVRMMSGYYNIAPDEVDDLIPEIAEFADLGDYLFAPVRTYSSGMMLRLAFAIATAKQPDIVLLDEVIGAGDAAFYEKAQARLDDFVQSTKMLVLASHSDELIRRFCNKAAVLESGQIVFEGEVDAALDDYHQRLARQAAAAAAATEASETSPARAAAPTTGQSPRGGASDFVDRHLAGLVSNAAQLIPASIRRFVRQVPPFDRLRDFVTCQFAATDAPPPSPYWRRPRFGTLMRRLFIVIRTGA